MWKITFGVASGIVLAGIIIIFFFVFLMSAASRNSDEAINHALQEYQSQIRQINASHPSAASISPSLRHYPSSLPIEPVPLTFPDRAFLIPKSRDELVRENSKKAYVKVRKEVADFKSQYKKPPECLDMQTSAIRMYCANAYIKAREAYEASNK
jgi:hypothetical protein